MNHSIHQSINQSITRFAETPLPSITDTNTNTYDQRTNRIVFGMHN